MTEVEVLNQAVRRVPNGRWGVAVSGGADSVALLRLLLERADLECHVIHLDHQTRAGASGVDAQFVHSLADAHGLSSTFSIRSELEAKSRGSIEGLGDGEEGDPKRQNGIESTAEPSAHANRSAYFRSLRLRLFESAVERHRLQGVVLAHHADDQAETVLLRLLRGGGYQALTGMTLQRTVSKVTLLRPLLGVRRVVLRDYLRGLNQPWREDASNEQDDYARNRIRKLLVRHPERVEPLLSVSRASADANGWLAKSSCNQEQGERLAVEELVALPDVLAESWVARWLTSQGVSANLLGSLHVSAVLRMARDTGSAARHAAPNGVMVRRRGGWIWAE